MTRKPYNKLGKTQQCILHSLVYSSHRGSWYANCGWIWGNYSTTVRLMESLLRAGWVTKEERPRLRNPNWTFTTYSICPDVDWGFLKCYPKD
jgi:hypothetical protein